MSEQDKAKATPTQEELSLVINKSEDAQSTNIVWTQMQSQQLSPKLEGMVPQPLPKDIKKHKSTVRAMIQRNLFEVTQDRQVVKRKKPDLVPSSPRVGTVIYPKMTQVALNDINTAKAPFLIFLIDLGRGRFGKLKKDPPCRVTANDLIAAEQLDKVFGNKKSSNIFAADMIFEKILTVNPDNGNLSDNTPEPLRAYFVHLLKKYATQRVTSMQDVSKHPLTKLKLNLELMEQGEEDEMTQLQTAGIMNTQVTLRQNIYADMMLRADEHFQEQQSQDKMKLMDKIDSSFLSVVTYDILDYWNKHSTIKTKLKLENFYPLNRLSFLDAGQDVMDLPAKLTPYISLRNIGTEMTLLGLEKCYNFFQQKILGSDILEVETDIYCRQLLECLQLVHNEWDFQIIYPALIIALPVRHLAPILLNWGQLNAALLAEDIKLDRKSCPQAHDLMVKEFTLLKRQPVAGWYFRSHKYSTGSKALLMDLSSSLHEAYKQSLFMDVDTEKEVAKRILGIEADLAEPDHRYYITRKEGLGPNYEFCAYEFEDIIRCDYLNQEGGGVQLAFEIRYKDGDIIYTDENEEGVKIEGTLETWATWEQLMPFRITRQLAIAHIFTASRSLQQMKRMYNHRAGAGSDNKGMVTIRDLQHDKQYAAFDGPHAVLSTDVIRPWPVTRGGNLCTLSALNASLNCVVWASIRSLLFSQRTRPSAFRHQQGSLWKQYLKDQNLSLRLLPWAVLRFDPVLKEYIWLSLKMLDCMDSRSIMGLADKNQSLTKYLDKITEGKLFYHVLVIQATHFPTTVMSNRGIKHLYVAHKIELIEDPDTYEWQVRDDEDPDFSDMNDLNWQRTLEKADIYVWEPEHHTNNFTQINPYYSSINSYLATRDQTPIKEHENFGGRKQLARNNAFELVSKYATEAAFNSIKRRRIPGSKYLGKVF